MRDGKIGLLFLGCGRATRLHSRTLRGAAGLIDLYFASRDMSRADGLCHRYGGRGSFGSYEAGLADPRIDVALVATPTTSHRELGLLAIEAGKHVIIEKPAFMRSSDADVVGDAARALSRMVLVAENYFYKPIAEHLRRVVTGGHLGDVRFIALNATKSQTTNDWRNDPSRSGGGALFEGGVHWINFASNIGLEVEAVTAHRVGAREGPDRSSLVVLRYTNGAVGTLAHSWEVAAPFGHVRLSKVQGTRGAVTFESNGLAQCTTGRRRSLGLYALRDPFGYRAMFTDFLGAIRTGAAARFTLEMARRDLALLEQAEESMSAMVCSG